MASDLLIGHAEIAAYLRVTVGWVKKQSRRLQREGILRRSVRGKPPRVQVTAFVEDLRRWIVARQGQRSGN